MGLIDKVKKAFRNPTLALYYASAIGRGTFYWIYYNFFKTNVRIKFPLLAHAPVHISGPGSVMIGNMCSIRNNIHDGLTITTFAKDVHVQIGNKCNLGGLTIRSKAGVAVGDRTMTANCLIQDAVLFSTETNTYRKIGVPDPKPISIGKNVWLGLFCKILNGTRIGDNSVVGSCAVIYDAEINNDCLATGNPAKRALPIEKILRMMKKR